MLLSEAEIKSEIHDVTRQFFTRHKDEFTNWGDALHWLHNTEFDVIEQEAASLGQNELRTEILWLISLFGPKEKINWDIANIRKVPALTEISEDSEEEAGAETKPVEVIQTPPRLTPRRKLRRRRY